MTSLASGGIKNEVQTFPVARSRSLAIEEPAGITQVRCQTAGEISLESDASHFVVAYEGEIIVSNGIQSHQLGAECFGVFQGGAKLEGQGSALVISVGGYCGQTLAGGPVESIGRLRYVDGCTSSMLLAPPMRGEPCLNFMHLPPAIAQTMHTHPSVRIGLILTGSGSCASPSGVVDFTPGTVFIIPPETPHSFRSDRETLRIVIYHPDSDSGPTHEDHTMLNRTFIAGQSAQELSGLHTKGATA